VAGLLTAGPLLFFLLAMGLPAAAQDATAPAADPRIVIHEGFAPEGACLSCHADQAAAFAKSHHARAMEVAGPATVRADFNDARFEHDGIATTFFMRDGKYLVRTEGPDGKAGEFEVKYTFAYDPLQQYLVDTGDGRLQALDIAWDVNKREWFWLGEGNPATPGSTLHWTGAFYRWNRTCIDCHSTDPKVGFDAATNSYTSTYVATSIGCQSCHGPGAGHVAWANSEPRPAPPASYGLAPAGMDMCVACHSRRTKVLEGYTAGKPFFDHFSPSLLRSDLYFPDGQIEDEVFEYGSFMQSKMARAGVICLDCHRAHEATVKAEGNGLCTQCHTPEPLERFANFKPGGDFDTPAHTHHPMGSEGAQCANCHMPARTYMKLDRRRDHSFVIPRPDLSALYGTPNACTTCHTGKSDAWASETMDGWYGEGWRSRPTTAHAFNAAARGDAAAVEALRQLVADTHLSGIVRGSAVAELGQFGPPVVVDIKAAAADADPLVRLGAAEAVNSLPPEVRLEAVGPLLSDPTQAVRLSAIRALSGMQAAQLPGDQRAAFEAAVGALRDYVTANADVAEAQNTYGLFLMDQQRPDDAEAALQHAIKLDPGFAGARINLAELYRATGQEEKSQAAYAEAIAISPEDAGVHFGYALALVRARQIDGAIDELRQAVRLEPSNSRYMTTLAIALDSVGRTEEGLGLLHQSIVGGGPEVSLLQTAIQFGLKLGRYPEVLQYAEALDRLQPGNPQIADLIGQLKAALGK
jgi:predicted CXXCH cytochrome family protein